MRIAPTLFILGLAKVLLVVDLKECLHLFYFCFHIYIQRLSLFPQMLVNSLANKLNPLVFVKKMIYNCQYYNFQILLRNLFQIYGKANLDFSEFHNFIISLINTKSLGYFYFHLLKILKNYHAFYINKQLVNFYLNGLNIPQDPHCPYVKIREKKQAQ